MYEEGESETVSPVYWMPFALSNYETYYFVNVNPKSNYYGLIKEFVMTDPSERLLSDLNGLMRLVAVFVELEATLRKYHGLCGQRIGEMTKRGKSLQRLTEAKFSTCEETLDSDLEAARKKLTDRLQEEERKKKECKKE